MPFLSEDELLVLHGRGISKGGLLVPHFLVQIFVHSEPIPRPVEALPVPRPTPPLSGQRALSSFLAPHTEYRRLPAHGSYSDE